MSRADELADRLFQQACDSSSVSGEAVAELRRLSAVNAELLGALKTARTMVGHPDNIAILDAAIQKAEEA